VGNTVRALSVALLLVLPGATFLAYLQFIGATSFEWRLFLLNYAWCSAVLYGCVLILMAFRANFGLWLTTLVAGNAALIGFCVWMASLLARGYRDTEIAWILIFPIQVFIIAFTVLAHRFLRRGKERSGSAANNSVNRTPD
jgi:hypothetical protein